MAAFDDSSGGGACDFMTKLEGVELALEEAGGDVDWDEADDLIMGDGSGGRDEAARRDCTEGEGGRPSIANKAFEDPSFLLVLVFVFAFVPLVRW